MSADADGALKFTFSTPGRGKQAIVCVLTEKDDQIRANTTIQKRMGLL